MSTEEVRFPQAVSFTGTRKGLTGEQKKTLFLFLKLWQPKSIHHGCAIGGDEEFSFIALDAAASPDVIPWEVGYPSNLDQFTSQRLSLDEEREKKPPLARNMDVVLAGDILIACPFEDDKPKNGRGGTWYTAGLATLLRKPLIIILPNGQFRSERIQEGWFAGLDPEARPYMDGLDDSPQE